MPRTFVAIAAKLHAVLDFRDGNVRRRLQVSQKRILAVDWRKDVRAGREPITQKIGQAAYQAGLEGLIGHFLAQSSCFDDDRECFFSCVLSVYLWSRK